MAISCASAPKPAERAPDAALYDGLGLPGDPQPFMENVRAGVLPSGLRYYILENAMPEGRAHLFLAVHAGSVLEADDEQGLAHFVEHMAFNGTERFPKFDLVEYLRSLGMRWGPEVNAYTSYDRTVYGIEVPVEFDAGGLKVIPDKALAVLDDWTRAVSFNAEDVDSERSVILEEARSRRGASERIRQKMLPLLFRGAPHADRSPIGLTEIIETAPAERLVNFYNRWYRADNMALIFVGDFDAAKLEAGLQSRFSIGAPKTPLDRPDYDLPEPEKGSLEAAIITDPEAPYTQIHLFYKLPPENSAGNLADYRNGLIEALIEAMLEQRLTEAAYDPETPFTIAGAGRSRYTRNSGYFMLLGIAKPGSAEAVLERLLLEKEKAARYGFTDSEIDRAKRSLLAGMARTVSEKDRLPSSSYLGGFIEHFINRRPVPGIEWSREAMDKLLPGIGAEEIAAVARSYFAYDDLRVFISGPDAEAANLPSQNRVKALVRRSSRSRIPRPADLALDDRLLDHEPDPGKILGESADAGALRWELGNGARVILKETKNKNNEVVLYALARGGVTTVPEEQIFSADTAAEMLSASGIGPYSQPDLMNKLAGKQVSIGFSLSAFTRNIQGTSTRGDLKTLFELLYLSFTQPRIDEGAAAALLDDYRTELSQHDQNPETVFSDEITRIMHNNNPYFMPMVLADLKKINTGDALAIIKRALNPADYVFVFTGNVDADELRPLVETYVASIPRAASSWNAWAEIALTRPGKMERAIYKGQDDKSLVYMAWTAAQEHTEEREAAAAVLSEYLENKLTGRIREQMGGTYSLAVGVSQSIFLSGGELNMSIYFPCAPGRVKELNAAILEELDSVAGGVIDQDALNKSVEALKKNFEISMQENFYIGRNYAAYSAIYDRPLSRLEQRPALYQGVAQSDIQQAAQKLLPGGPVTVILYPENTKEGTKND
ncbi:MAG: insulinase family protein [Treponema sp.]|nr:insulinase family protein [Treponema sp.]